MLGAATSTAETAPPDAPTPIISGAHTTTATATPKTTTQQGYTTHSVPLITIAPLSILSVAAITIALYWILVYQNPVRYGSSRKKAQPALLGALALATLLSAATIYIAYTG
jgi:hypothetical protein